MKVILNTVVEPFMHNIWLLVRLSIEFVLTLHFVTHSVQLISDVNVWHNTTIQHVLDIFKEALIEVAQMKIERMDLEDNQKKLVAQMCGYAFDQAKQEADRMFKELKRIYYVTPTNFIELLKGYEKILNAKRKEIGNQIKKLSNGLSSLEESSEAVRQMTVESEVTRQEVSKASQECQELKISLDKKERAANEKKTEI